MATHETAQTRETTAGWRARLGPRAQIAVATVLLVGVGIFAGNAYLGQQYGPEGAVRHYFAALQGGDARGAFADLSLGHAATATDVALVDQAAMTAALRISRPSFPALDVSAATTTGSLAVLTARYQAAGGRKQLGLTLVRASAERQLGIYPRWRIAVVPSVLKVAVPAGATAVQVDGVPVALPGGRTSTIGVLPMAHQVSLPATPMLTGQSVAIDATSANPDGWSVTYAPKLTASGQSQATAALKGAFAACAASTAVSPSGCPQSLGSAPSVQWRLIGDPTAGVTLGTDKQSQPTASGHYIFVASAANSSGAVGHVAVGSGYTAQLKVTTSDVAIAGIANDTTLSAATRPSAATDQIAMDLLQKAFAACAAATDAAPADCPQYSVAAYKQSKNVRWSLSGDPTSGATVIWDGNQSALLVKGPFSMSIDYDATFAGGGHYRNASDSKNYAATLIVDGSELRLVTIKGDL